MNSVVTLKWYHVTAMDILLRGMQCDGPDTLLVVGEHSLGLASCQVPQPDGGVMTTRHYLEERSFQRHVNLLNQSQKQPMGLQPSTCSNRHACM